MCNLGIAIEREGIAKGRAEGMAKGMAKGVITSIQNLMETTCWSAEQAMEALKIPENERQRYAELLTKQ